MFLLKRRGIRYRIFTCINEALVKKTDARAFLDFYGFPVLHTHTNKQTYIYIYMYIHTCMYFTLSAAVLSVQHNILARNANESETSLLLKSFVLTTRVWYLKIIYFMQIIDFLALLTKFNYSYLCSY